MIPVVQWRQFRQALKFIFFFVAAYFSEVDGCGDFVDFVDFCLETRARPPTDREHLTEQNLPEPYVLSCGFLHNSHDSSGIVPPFGAIGTNLRADCIIVSGTLVDGMYGWDPMDDAEFFSFLNTAWWPHGAQETRGHCR